MNIRAVLHIDGLAGHRLLFYTSDVHTYSLKLTTFKYDNTDKQKKASSMNDENQTPDHVISRPNHVRRDRERPTAAKSRCALFLRCPLHDLLHYVPRSGTEFIGHETLALMTYQGSLDHTPLVPGDADIALSRPCRGGSTALALSPHPRMEIAITRAPCAGLEVGENHHLYLAAMSERLSPAV